jgi:catechol 2,3-dioxygenase-like lactoylglutathione lyase family enzyme
MIANQNWKFSHAGLIVKDTARTCEHYRQLGFEVLKGPYTTPAKYPDNPMNSVVAWIKKDAIVFEVIQPLEGRWVNKEFLDTIGEGVNHICFTVDNIAEERQRLEGMGFPVVYGFTVPLGTFAYFDTRKAGNLIIELLEPTKTA